MVLTVFLFILLLNPAQSQVISLDENRDGEDQRPVPDDLEKSKNMEQLNQTSAKKDYNAGDDQLDNMQYTTKQDGIEQYTPGYEQNDSPTLRSTPPNLESIPQDSIDSDQHFIKDLRTVDEEATQNDDNDTIDNENIEDDTDYDVRGSQDADGEGDANEDGADGGDGVNEDVDNMDDGNDSDDEDNGDADIEEGDGDFDDDDGNNNDDTVKDDQGEPGDLNDLFRDEDEQTDAALKTDDSDTYAQIDDELYIKSALAGNSLHEWNQPVLIVRDGYKDTSMMASVYCWIALFCFISLAGFFLAVRGHHFCHNMFHRRGRYKSYRNDHDKQQLV